jgi:hypothetical protein
MTRHLFTVLLSVLLLPAAAAADRVVLLPPTGTASEERLDHVEEALSAAIRAAGHETLTEGTVVAGRDAPPPETANEMTAIAEMQDAQWVVVTRMTDLEGRYELVLRVGYAPQMRIEELQVTVSNAGEAERLTDVLRSMLRPEGVGDDAVRLTEEDAAPGDDGSAAEDAARREEEERLRGEQEERSRADFERRERELAEEAERREQEAWDNRERYGAREGRVWLIQASADMRAIIAVDSDRDGGLLTGLSARIGRAFEGVPGLELRGAFDVVTGATSGFAVAGGAVYYTSPFTDLPVFIGGTVELGMFQALTGNRVPSFLVRVSPAVAWRVADNIYLEGVFPEFQYLSANGGVGTLGLGVRVGTRF